MITGCTRCFSEGSVRITVTMSYANETRHVEKMSPAGISVCHPSNEDRPSRSTSSNKPKQQTTEQPAGLLEFYSS